jgi:hypothetical protein
VTSATTSGAGTLISASALLLLCEAALPALRSPLRRAQQSRCEARATCPFPPSQPQRLLRRASPPHEGRASSAVNPVRGCQASAICSRTPDLRLCFLCVLRALGGESCRQFKGANGSIILGPAGACVPFGRFRRVWTLPSHLGATVPFGGQSPEETHPARQGRLQNGDCALGIPDCSPALPSPARAGRMISARVPSLRPPVPS